MWFLKSPVPVTFIIIIHPHFFLILMVFTFLIWHFILLWEKWENINAEHEQRKNSDDYTLHAPYIAEFSVCKLNVSRHHSDMKNLMCCLGCKCLQARHKWLPLTNTKRNTQSNACKQDTNGFAQHLKKNKNIQLTGKTECS